jgi:hypothetical protein
MTDAKTIQEKLHRILNHQKLGVLATHGQEQSYASLVAFVPADGLSTLVFATSRRTRKFQNLTLNAHAALLVDTRSPEDTTFTHTTAVTAFGNVVEFTGSRRLAMQDLYLGIHPHLRDFVGSPDCALLGILVDGYVHVDEFQKVARWNPPPRPGRTAEGD